MTEEVTEPAEEKWPLGRAPRARRQPDIRHRIGMLLRVVLRERHMRVIQAIFGRFGESGGPLIAAGLAFYALFAMLPGVLLMVGLTGLWASDPDNRLALLQELIDRFPPVAAFLRENLQKLVEGGGAISIVGAIGAFWGASSFYGVMDEAMARFFPGGRVRNIIEQRIRGLIAVVALMAAAVAVIVIGSAWSFAENQPSPAGPPAIRAAHEAGLLVLRVLSPTITIASFVAAVLVVFKIVPTMAPSLRAALIPSVVTGVAIAVITGLFGLVANLMIGGLAAFGVIATLFGALIWLNYVFQVLLLGAAWARVRRDREAAAADDPVPVPATAAPKSALERDRDDDRAAAGAEVEGG